MSKKTSDNFERGMKIRREVLGDEYVDNATKNGWRFAQDFQEIVTEGCWGATWGRGTFSRRERSLLTLAMTAALNREQEFEIHIRGALRNGCTPEELKELCIHVNAYCGAPAAVSSFRSLRKVFGELGIEV